MKKWIKMTMVGILTITLIGFLTTQGLKKIGTNSNPLQVAEQTESPNMNFMFASNTSWVGRIYMTFSGKEFKPCINTVSSFFNKYHTCSNCVDFEKNPEEWNFIKVDQPKAGDIAIQHDAKTGRAYHAVIIVSIENEKYYISHAVRSKYFKNVELKNKSNLTFYRYKTDF